MYRLVGLVMDHRGPIGITIGIIFYGAYIQVTGLN